MGRTATRVTWAILLGAAVSPIGVVGGTGVASAGTAAPTLNASKHIAGLPAVPYGHSIKLSGRERDAGLRTVVLESNGFPYAAGFQKIAQEQTHGTYAFTVKPSRASQYRVLVKGATGQTSHVVTVYVATQGVTTQCNLCRLSNSPGAHVLVVTGQLKPSSGTGPVYFYYAQANGSSVAPSTLNLVKTVSPQVTTGGVSFSVSYHVQFPSGPSRFRYSYCRQDDEAHDGFGLPGHHHCGDAMVTATEYLG